MGVVPSSPLAGRISNAGRSPDNSFYFFNWTSGLFYEREKAPPKRGRSCLLLEENPKGGKSIPAPILKVTANIARLPYIPLAGFGIEKVNVIGFASVGA